MICHDINQLNIDLNLSRPPFLCKATGSMNTFLLISIKNLDGKKFY